MRSTFRSILLLGLAVSAFGAVTAAGAQAALPQFHVPPTGNVKFTGTATAVQFSSTIGEYSCSSASVTGEVEKGFSKTAKNVVVTFKCGNSYFCAKEWQTKPLTGTLGYVSKATKVVGLLLAAPSGPVAECPKGFPVAADILGSLVMAISPVNSMVKEYSLVSKIVAGSHEQEIRKFEGETEPHVLEYLAEGGIERHSLAMAAHFAVSFERSVEIEA